MEYSIQFNSRRSPKEKNKLSEGVLKMLNLKQFIIDILDFPEIALAGCLFKDFENLFTEAL